MPGPRMPDERQILIVNHKFAHRSIRHSHVSPRPAALTSKKRIAYWNYIHVIRFSKKKSNLLDYDYLAARARGRPESASACVGSQQAQGAGALDGLGSAVGVELGVEMAHVGSDG